MGGCGSGRLFRYNTKGKVESCCNLDIRYLKKNDLLTPGMTCTLSWSCNGRDTGSISMSAKTDHIELIYKHRSPREAEWEDVKQPVSLTWTPCNYGGKRPWFICPGVVNGRYCGRRVAVLYAGGKYFLCRHCYDLTYNSRNESRLDRLMTKERKIRKRLGVSNGKPKGMHWSTYSHLQRELTNINDVIGETMRLTFISQFGYDPLIGRVNPRQYP